MNWWALHPVRGRRARLGTGAGPAPGHVTQRRARAGTSVADAGSRDSPSPPASTDTQGAGRRSAGGYQIAVAGHRWRPADEQERSRLTRMAVDRGAKPQTGRVISAPLILDRPGHPGSGRSPCCCCAVMGVTRFKDAAAAVSRICGRGSPIPISAQVRGLLVIVMHRCAAAVGSAHRRVFPAVESHPPDPDRPHGGHSSLTARARCAQHGPSLSTPPPPGPPPHPNRPHLPTDSKAAATPPGRPHLHAEPSSSPSAFRPAANADGDIPRGQVRLAPGGGIRRRRGQQSRPHTRNTSPAGRNSPRTRRMSPHASELSATRRTLVVPNAARLPLSRGHRCPRMATDSTTADTTFVRAALRTIVTIGDS